MFGLGKKRKVDNNGVVWERRDEAIERQIANEKEFGSFLGFVECPSCYKITGLKTASMSCEYCGKSLGVEGLNRLTSGEDFYYCTRCNTKFASRQDYRDHHFKCGHA